jgi:hypothetical protein
MKSIIADAIEAGKLPYSLSALNKDIMAAIVKDEILNKDVVFSSNLYMRIIHMLALGYKSKIIIYTINEQMPLNWPEEDIRFHISRVKSNYKEFVEIMDAIFHAKYEDFIKLGASKEQAFYSVDEWISSEFF